MSYIFFSALYLGEPLVQNVPDAKDHAAPHGEQLPCSAPRPDEPSKIKGFTEKGERGCRGWHVSVERQGYWWVETPESTANTHCSFNFTMRVISKKKHRCQLDPFSSCVVCQPRSLSERMLTCEQHWSRCYADMRYQWEKHSTPNTVSACFKGQFGILIIHAHFPESSCLS